MRDWILDTQTGDLAMCRDQPAGASYYIKKSGPDLSLTIELRRQGVAPARLTILPFGHFGVAVEAALLWRTEMMGVEPISVSDADLRITRGRVRKPDAQHVIRLANRMTPRFASDLIVRAFTAAEMGKDVTATAKRFSDQYRKDKVDTGLSSGYRVQQDIFREDRPAPVQPKVPEAPPKTTDAPATRPASDRAKAEPVLKDAPKPVFRAQPPIPIHEVVHERASIGVIYKLDVRSGDGGQTRQEEKGSLLSRFLIGRKK
ncbi:hypothetical protein IC232_03530 [Microvirga sp. BT688]|uniref:hypothetical protein n=1 Tax=Microvirga sp. TaxID=1873136 RepID=UPI0016865FFE|nr:hypothetical protein [Microvirga sp.]MBD2745761.1 hypothetical protein [Microvirga sp.]